MNPLIVRKLASLVEVIDDLRDQLRVVLAAELSKAIATTVREVLDALIGGRSVPAREPPFGNPDHPTTAGHGDWDDPRGPSRSFDRYDDPEEFDDPEPEFEQPESVAPTVISTPAISLALAAGHWAWRQTRSRWWGLAGTLAVGLAAACGGPVTRSVLAAAAAVHQLAGFGASPLTPSD